MKILKDYYVKQWSMIISPQARSPFLCILLLTIQNFLLYQFYFREGKELIIGDSVSFIYQALRYINILDYVHNSIIILSFLSAINFILACLIVLDIGSFWRNKYSYKSQGYHIMLNFTFKVYEYTLMPASIMVSFCDLSDPISIINLILTFLIGVTVTISSFSYSLSEERDCLQRQGNLTFVLLLKIVSQIVLSLNKELIKLDIQPYLLGMVGVSNMTAQLMYQVYTHKQARVYFMQLNIIFTSLFLILSTDHIFAVQDFHLACFTFLPLLCFKMYSIIEDGYEKQMYYGIGIVNTTQKSIKLTSFQINFFVQNSLERLISSFGNYERDELSLLIEQMSVNHMQYCMKFPDCFCNYSIEQDVWSNLISGDKRKKFFLSCMINYFDTTQYINSSQDLDVESQLIFINILIHCSDSPIPATKEIYQLLKQEQDKCTLRQRMYLQQLKHKSIQKLRAISKFDKEQQQQPVEENECNYFVSAAVFENKIMQICELLQKCLHYKSHLLQLLNSDSVQLTQLNLIATAFLQERCNMKYILNEIKSSIELQNANSFQNIFEHLQVGFSEILFEQYTFGQSAWQNNKMKSKYLEQHTKSSSTSTSNMKILVSVEKQKVGSILRKDKQFCEVFGMRKEQELDLNNILSEELGDIHQTSMLNAIQGLYSPQQVQQPHQNIILANDSDGYAIPFQINTQFQINYDQDQFGIICSLQQIHNNFNYILLNTRTSSFITANKLFYSTYLSRYGTMKTLKSLKLWNLIPSLFQMLNNITNAQNNRDEQKIIFFQPQEQSNSSEGSEGYLKLVFSKDNPNLHHIEKLLHYSSTSIFQLTVKCSPIFNKEFVMIEIIQIQKVLEQELFQSLNQLRQEFQLEEISQYQRYQNTEENIVSILVNNMSHLSIIMITQRQFYNAILLDLCPETNERYSMLNLQKSQCWDTTNGDMQTLKGFSRNANETTRSDLLLHQISSRREILSQSQIYNFKDTNSTTLHILKNKEGQLNNTIQNKYRRIKGDHQSEFEGYEQNSNNEISEEQDNQAMMISLAKKGIKQDLSKKIAKKLVNGIVGGAAPSLQMSTSTQKQHHQKMKLEISSCKKRVVYSKVMASMSVVGMICILILSLTYYFKAKVLFENQKQKLKHVSWPMSIRSISSTQLFYAQYIKYIDQDIFPGIRESWQDFKQVNINRIQKVNVEFDDIMIQIIECDKGQYPYFKNITQLSFNFTYLRDDRSYNRVSENQTESYFYFLLMYFKYIKRYSTKIYDVLNEESFDFDNFLNFNGVITELQEIIEDEAKQNMQSITENYQEVSYAIIVISSAIVFIFFAIIFYTKLNTSNYLKLITTFTPHNINQMINEVALSKTHLDYFKANYTFSTPNSPPKNNQNKPLLANIPLSTTTQKKKIISVTSTLPVLSFQLISSLFIKFVVLVIPPIVVAQLISSQTEECSTNLKLMSVLYDMRGHIASNMFLNIGLIYQRMYPKNDYYRQDQFDMELPFFIDLNNQKLNNLGSLISEEINKKRYKQYYYDKFFYKALKGDLCEAFYEYPTFLAISDYKFNIEDCSSMRNRILTKGFQLSSTFFFDQIKPIFEILNDPKDLESRQIFTDWVQKFDLLEFDRFVDYLLNSITSFKNFIIFMSDDYLVFMEQVQLILLVLYLSLIIAFCSFLSKNILSYINKESNLSKSIVTIISRDHIFNNNYIMNQLQKK